MTKKKLASQVAARADKAFAQVAHLPIARHTVLSLTLGARVFSSAERPSLKASVSVMREQADAVAKGDMGSLSDMLYAQAMTLDTVFTELLRRSCANLGEHPIAAERYMHTALKAQVASRSTVEALTRLHQQQTVKHVHVNNGGQAVIADEFHNHSGNNNGTQPHASSRLDASGTPLRREDEIRQPVPVASR